MKKMHSLAIIVIWFVTTAADAAVVGTVTLKRDPANGIAFASPDADLGAPWVSYVLGLQSTAGELIAAVDVSITGTLHQRWTFNEDIGVFYPTANSTNTTNGDSHLTAPPGQLFDCLGFCPLEDNSGIGSPLSDTMLYDYGVGTLLIGVFGFAPESTTASLAYIVIPKWSEPLVDIRVRVANSQGNVIADLNERDFFPVPEPAAIAMGCVALAALECVRRRRLN